jgi:ribonuclease D
MHIHSLIEDSAALANLCARLAESPFVAVDTEFMRENSYWPELCLIQIADANEAAAIDPMKEGLDLGPLLDLLVNNENVLKVFHAGAQDIEIVYNLTGKTPHPLFDTQIAAMALGQGEQIGYSNLVDSWLGIQLDKGARFTDWARDPSIGTVSPDARKIAQNGTRRLARPGNGKASRSGKLHQRTRTVLEANPHRRA